MAVSAWVSAKLGELVEIKHGWPFKSEYFREGSTGQPVVVSVGNFRYTGGFRFDETAIKEYCDDYPKEYELVPGDILLIMTCQTAGGEILGIPARVPNDGRVYLHNQRLGKVWIRDKRKVELDYLYWLFLSPDFNRELVTSASGTKILHTAPSRIEAFRFQLPPSAEQRAIAQILGSLDDKIELNRHMNETLEAMTRALFKSWFVDFDPVRAKAEGRDTGLSKHIADLFPSSLEDSELGEIPKGWAIKRIDDIADVVGGSTPSTEDLSYWEGGTHAWVTPKDLSRLSVPVLLDSDRRITDAGLSQIGSGILPKGTVLISSRAPIGYLAIAEIPVAINQGFIAMKPLKSVSNLFLLLWARSAHEEIVSRANGSTFLEISKSNFRPILVVMPTNPVMQAFERLVRPLYERIVDSTKESATLTRIRDLLLQKLVSGELRLQNPERFSSAAISKLDS
jgi:type I restriction enzyme, S subunit